MYFDEFLLIPAVFDQTLAVFNIQARFVMNYRLYMNLPPENVCCFLNPKLVICVGGLEQGKVTASAYTIEVPTANIRVTPMREARLMPAIYPNNTHLYVFGGKEAKSCEKLMTSPMAWAPLTDMSEDRWSFSPVRFSKELYLLDPRPSLRYFEAFHLDTETFRNLPLNIHVQSNSVSIGVKGKLHCITEKYLMRWGIEPYSKLRVEHLASERKVKICNASLPQRWFSQVYFWNGNEKNLICANFKERKMGEVTGFKKIIM